MQLHRTHFLGSAALIGALALTACIPPAPQPTPVPTPSPVAQPAPTPAPPVAPVTAVLDNWADNLATPGDWAYSDRTGAPVASFGMPGQSPLFAMQCNRANRSISLGRLSNASDPRTMRIRTETMDRDLRAEPQAGSAASILAAVLPASDPFLDAMAFSKGRFAVQVAGEPVLYIPAWPEVTRVIEECRN